MRLLLNIAAFQIGWLVSVLGAANRVPILGPVVVALVVAAHLKTAAHPGRELALILLAGLLGGGWDSVLVSAGWVSYPSGILVAGVAPYWIVAMWMLFATTLNVSLTWLQTRIGLAAALGAVAGPLAYYAGARLGGIEFLDPRAGLTALGVGWAVMLPLLAALARRLDGIRVSAVSAAPAPDRVMGGA